MRAGLLLILLAVAVMAAPHPANADFATGVEAYDGGDLETARAAFRDAAMAGDPAAQVALAGLYHYGEGVTRDLARAANWYARAAEQGDAVAQANLAALYRAGDGVPADRAVAFAWLSLAAAQGHRWATARRAAWRADLSQAERARASKLIARLSAPATTLSGTAAVIDGQTLELAGHRLRLEGIAAPALGARCRLRGAERDCGLISSAGLKDLTAGATVTCERRASVAADGVPRAACQADGYDLSEGMVYTGWARADLTQMARYEALERDAREARRGMWRPD